MCVQTYTYKQTNKQIQDKLTHTNKHKTNFQPSTELIALIAPNWQTFQMLQL